MTNPTAATQPPTTEPQDPLDGATVEFVRFDEDASRSDQEWRVTLASGSVLRVLTFIRPFHDGPGERMLVLIYEDTHLLRNDYCHKLDGPVTSLLEPLHRAMELIR